MTGFVIEYKYKTTWKKGKVSDNLKGELSGYLWPLKGPCFFLFTHMVYLTLRALRRLFGDALDIILFFDLLLSLLLLFLPFLPAFLLLFLDLLFFL